MNMAGFDIMGLLPLALIFVVFYFLLIRPQQKKMKTHQAMLSALRRGDRVVTNGGLIGTVSKIVNEQELQLEVSENVKVRVMRGMISDVMAKGTPLPEEESVTKPSAALKSSASVSKKKDKKKTVPANTTRQTKKKK